ncbi:MAG: ABC transporter ATP-binding protein [Rhodobacteraceae bacterium]|nr:ABC transporter ATP-binding protein [Paracoccaceae bacterium]MCY4140419.1 ABC transporter ATP-binding protein [Paracoccaceae bacterium]
MNQQVNPRSDRANLELIGIEKTFGENRVIQGVELSVADGEFLTLLGPSGCGKTTLLRLIAGLTSAEKGMIRIDGEPVDQLPPRSRGVAMVFQNYALYPHLTAHGNLAAPLELLRLSFSQRLPFIGRFLPGQDGIRAEIENDIRATAAILEIEPLLDRKPDELSGGQRQRVALGRAMVHHPKIFLMDEPLANLDANLRAHMRSELTALQRRLGVTFIFVTHDQTEAMTMSDRIAVIFEGRIRQIGTPADVFRQPNHIDVAAFLTHPRLNRWRISPTGAGEASFNGQPIRTPVSGPGTTTLAFRPEDTLVETRETAKHVRGEVIRVELLGSDGLMHVQVQDGERPIVVRTPAPRLDDFKPGGPIWLAPNIDHAWCFDDDGERVKGAVEAVVV